MLLTVPCGGGHRAWDMNSSIIAEQQLVRFVHIQSRNVLLSTANIHGNHYMITVSKLDARHSYGFRRG